MPSLNERLLAVIKTQSEIAKLGLDLGRVMEVVCVRAQELTASIGAVVELAEGDEMVYRAASGTFGPHLGLRLQRHDSLSGLCVELGHPIRCDDSETDPRVNRDACRRVGLRSMIVVPLRHHEATVGVLKVMSDVPNAFSADDLEALGMISELIAAAMFHAAKYETSRLIYEATHDALTGLANRALFYDRLRECLAKAEKENRRIGVMNLDMDGLKPINDTLGHRAGDAALKAFAERLRQAAQDADTVARVGGDEFALIFPKLEDREAALERIRAINENVGTPFAFESSPVVLGASIGVALFPDDARKLDDLLEHADRSMYAVKRTRKNAR